MNIGNVFWYRVVPASMVLTMIAVVGEIWWLKLMLLPVAIVVIVWTIYLVVET